LKSTEDHLFHERLVAHFGDRVAEFSVDLLEMFHGLWIDGQLHGAGLLCDRCGATEGVKLIGAMTSYTETEDNPDPNHPTPYCLPCAKEYEEHWQEMWDEYNAGRL